jgi:hypothetical protein
VRPQPGLRRRHRRARHRQRGRREHLRLRHDAAARHAADAHGLFAFLDLDFGDARLFEQLDQLFDFTDIHRSPE